LEIEGSQSLTVHSLASQLGIKTPSLYKHVRNKRELEAELIAGGLIKQVVATSRNPTEGFDTGRRRSYTPCSTG
jgi:AcrR family transcriptional regulator